MNDVFKWYELFPNLYRSEINLLKRGLENVFKLNSVLEPSQNNNKIIAKGTIFWGSNNEQGVKIIFPAKYPSAPPKLIAVDYTRNADNVIINDNPHHFNEGNQFNDGSMCFFRKDAWNKDLHNIGWCLKRAQSWLSSVNSKDGFKPDEIVEEKPPLIPYHGQVIFPSRFSPPENLETGEILLTQFKPDHYILEKNIISNSPFSLQLNIEIFRWIKVKQGLSLKQILFENGENNIAQLVIKHFGGSILNTSINSPLNIALYIPNDSMSWHFFKFSPQKTNSGIQFNLVRYYISRIVEDELYLRTKDIFDEEVLKSKYVTIIGLGSLGSEVARSLARNGVGSFNLFDNDTFELGNSVRHAADLFHIGDRKVDVVKKLILKSNPNILVNGYSVDVMDDDSLIEDSLAKSDLCIVLTGEDNVDYFFNDYYVHRYNIPFIFAGVAPGGLSGSVQVVEHGQTACLRCLSNYGIDTLPKPKTEIHFHELPLEFGSCSAPALPGSEIDTKEIALQLSRVSLQCLLRNTNSNYPALNGSQFYWHGPHGSATQDPFTWEITNVDKDSKCEYCNK